MDSMKGLALGVGTEISGVSANIFYSRAEKAGIDTTKALTKNGAVDAFADETNPTPEELAAYAASRFDDDPGLFGGAGDDLRDTHTAKRTGLGVSASISAGEGATITIGYSTVKTQRSHKNGLDRVAVPAVDAVTAVPATVNTPAVEEVEAADAITELAGTKDTWSLVSSKTKLIEIDFSYDLGGGAALNAGIDQKDEGEGKKTTTLEASISMSF